MRNVAGSTSPTKKTRVFTSSSSSSSSSSSLLPQNLRIRTTEQVWRDLTFSSPRPPPPPPISSQQQNPNDNSNNNHAILQDFFGLNHPSRNTSRGTLSHHHHDLNEIPNVAPPTSLSLNNSSGLATDNNNGGPSYFSEAVVNNNAIFSFCPNYNYNNYIIMNKREMVAEICSSVGDDRRHKRMMKNRESAARSRARKQAYTNELELEVAHLAAENEKLRKQYEELSLAMASQHSTKKTLKRTLTAPF